MVVTNPTYGLLMDPLKNQIWPFFGTPLDSSPIKNLRPSGVANPPGEK